MKSIPKNPFLEQDESNDLFRFTYNDFELSAAKCFRHLFKTYGSSLRIQKKIDVEKCFKLIKEAFKDTITEENIFLWNKIDDINKPKKLVAFIIIVKDNLIVDFTKGLQTILFSHKTNEEDLIKLQEILKKSVRQTELKDKFYVCEKEDYGNLNITAFDIKKTEVNIDENYNNCFIDADKRIKEFLSTKNTSGLIVLHGISGTGKTTYLRHLISSVHQQFIYFPIELVGQLSSPDFLSFNKRNKNSVLIIEDCEKLLMSRENSNSSNGLVDLLNFSDGLMGDAFSFKIICTFNTKRSGIDKAILRKGRTRVMYEFKELCADKSNNLLKKLGKDNNINKLMKLSDIYYYDDPVLSEENKEIGFLNNQS